MSLDELEILFDEADLDFDAPTSNQLYIMYGHFLNHFHKTPLIHKGRRIVFNTNPGKSTQIDPLLPA